jgi:hypothetical protein
VFDAGAEVAGRDDLTSGGADDAGEEGVDFLEVQGDDGGAGLLEGSHAGDDGFAEEETVAAGGGYTAGAGRTGIWVGRAGWVGRAVVFRAVDV